MAAGLLGHYGEPVFYAFASPQDDEHGLRWYLERTEATCGQVTYANLWINSFYARTKELLLSLITTPHTRSRIVLIANHVGIGSYAPCHVAGQVGELLGCVPVPDDAVKSWEDDELRASTLRAALDAVDAAPPGSLFIVCAGPLSKPLIAAMWGRSHAHQVVDFGSALDEVLKGKRTRPYMDPDSPYARGIDPQWFCHRGPLAVQGFSMANVSAEASTFGMDARCHTFSIPEGE